MNMTGYMPTDEDIAAMVRDLEMTDPDNANADYAREKLIRIKLMFRELGRIDNELFEKELKQFKSSNLFNTSDKQSDL